MKSRKHLRYAFLFFLLTAAALILPVRAQAAVKYGKIAEKWVKSGKYSFMLNDDMDLLYRENGGAAKTISSDVNSARFYGTTVAFSHTFRFQGSVTRTSTYCAIYDCAAGKITYDYSLSDIEIKGVHTPLGLIEGFYQNTVVFTGEWNQPYLGIVDMTTGSVNRAFASGYNLVYPGMIQYNQYMIFLNNTYAFPNYTKLQVLNLANGKLQTFSNKGYAVSLVGGKLYYAEVAAAKKNENGTIIGEVRKQTVRIYRRNLNGKGKKLMAFFKINGKYAYDPLYFYKIPFSVIPTKTCAYYCIRPTGQKAVYKMISYKTKKIQNVSQSTFEKKEATANMLAEGITYYK